MANVYWKGASATSWATLSNWSQGIDGSVNVTTIPGAADNAFFNSNLVTTARTINLVANRSIKGIVLNANNGGTTIAGGSTTTYSLTLGIDGIVMTASSGNLTMNTRARTIVSNLLTPLTAGSGSTITFNGEIQNGASSGGFDINGPGTVVFSSVLSVPTFSGGVTVSNGVVQAPPGYVGTGTITLSGGLFGNRVEGDSTYTNNFIFSGNVTLGNTDLSQFDLNGTVSVTANSTITWPNSSALRFLNTVTISSGATFTVNNTSSNYVAFNGQVTGAGSVGLSSGVLVMGSSTPSHNYTGGTNVTGGTLRVNSGALGTNTLSVSGGRVTSGDNATKSFTTGISLSGTASFGDTNASFNGTLIFSGSSTFSGTSVATVDSALTLSGAVSGASNATFTKAGSSTLTLGAANTFSGTTRVTLGTLTVSNVNGLQNSTVDWGTSTVGTLTLPASAVLGGLSTASGTANTFTRASAYSVGNNNENTTFSGVLAGTGGITKSGTGTWTLDGPSANTNTGTFTVSAGTVNANKATALGAASSTAAITVSSGATLSAGAALNYSSPGRSTTISGTGVSGVEAGCLVLANAGPINLGAINATNNTYVRGTTTTQLTSAIAWSGSGGLRLGAATGTTVTFSGAISVSSGTLTAILFGRSNNPDLGTVVLGTTNTFAAPAQIDFGTLRVSADNNLGTAPGVATAAYLIVGGSTTLATTATFTLNANRGIALGPASGSGTGTIEVASATTLTYGGVIANNSAGAGKLAKAATGTLKLTGANTYTGGTDINAGVVQAGNIQALGTSGTVTLGASGTLQTLTTGGQNGKLTVAALNNAAGGIIRIGG